MISAVYLANAFWLAPEPEGEARITAHRGIHQLYDRVGINGLIWTYAIELVGPAWKEKAHGLEGGT